ncbi:Uncharacterised protein [Acinetobacter baumannii]|uniref:hypothetical protein n=1 Tax=Acinetobacter baumannii TaxID=470 RepID=UPI000DE7850D|nr:hypothetical protein [Acinetobacter baumannii]MBJ9579593.1 hypothetical protein [Acinetobacter baumannii]SSS46689.1 Uncharacterised protein [Acinetobacter baumannii]
MKKLTLFLVLICTGISAHSEVDYKLAQDSCSLMESVAFAAQTYRQMGHKPSGTLDKLMETANKIEDTQYKDIVSRLVFDVVENAYSIQLYSTKALKDKAITQFTETNYLSCINVFKKRLEEKESI